MFLLLLFEILNYFIVYGFDEDLNIVMKNVFFDMFELLSEYRGLSKDDVYFFMSVGSDFMVM